MMKHILAVFGLLALPACTANFPAARPTAPGMAAPITPPAQNVIPPVEFDHPYTGKLTIERSSSQAEIKARCAPTSFSYHLGCAWAMAGRCHILMADDATIREHNWTQEIVLRHERGHCNFWPAHHPGARRPD